MYFSQYTSRVSALQFGHCCMDSKWFKDCVNRLINFHIFVILSDIKVFECVLRPQNSFFAGLGEIAKHSRSPHSHSYYITLWACFSLSWYWLFVLLHIIYVVIQLYAIFIILSRTNIHYNKMSSRVLTRI